MAVPPPVVPTVSLSPIPARSIAPDPLALTLIVVSGVVPPIVPPIVADPLPVVIVKFSAWLPVPSIVPSIWSAPPPVPVLIVVVPAVLKTIFPPSKVKLLFAVVIETSAPVIRIELLPDAAS